MNDRFQQLQIFVRTVETGSFSKVAREFGLTQPSVSRIIAALEERLGVKLFTRTTRQLSLTAAGEALLPGAREALSGVEGAESAARGANTLVGLLRLAMPATYGTRQIVPVLPGFLEQHPDLRIDLLMSDRFENLIAEGADIALRLGNLPDSSFVTRKLAAVRRLFVAAPSYLARRGTPKSLGDLGQHHLIGSPSDGDDLKWTARRADVLEIQPVSPRIRTPSAAGAVACAVAGLGIAIVSTWMSDQELSSGALVEILPGYQLDPAIAHIVFPAGRHPSAKARALSDFLEAAVRGSGG